MCVKIPNLKKWEVNNLEKWGGGVLFWDLGIVDSKLRETQEEIPRTKRGRFLGTRTFF